jgi:hypothetical protein
MKWSADGKANARAALAARAIARLARAIPGPDGAELRRLARAFTDRLTRN